MKKSTGGGIGDEIIEVVELTVPEMQKYLEENINYPPHLAFGFYWFMGNKYKTPF